MYKSFFLNRIMSLIVNQNSEKMYTRMTKELAYKSKLETNRNSMGKWDEKVLKLTTSI